ncbi:hypothetical protein KR018_000009, partial [Drosophila ironensis]
QRLYKSHWLGDYADDIYESMREQELRRRPNLFSSSQLDQRPRIIKILESATHTYKLSRCAMHLALYYLDCFLDSFRVRPDKLQLVTLTCLHLAAQIENTDALIPRFSEMNRLVRNAYEPGEYKAVERKILSFLNFELVRPTTASFVELFACRFLTRADYVEYKEMLEAAPPDPNIQHPYKFYKSYEEMLTALAKLMLQICDSSLFITSFAGETPSLLAAACIAAVRQVSGVKRWSQHLVTLTSYNESQVRQLADVLALNYYYKPNPVDLIEYPEGPPVTPVTPDSGFTDALNPNIELASIGEGGGIKVISVQLLQPATIPSSPSKREAMLKRRHNLDGIEAIQPAAKQPKLGAT